jgi:hypothetical protein
MALIDGEVEVPRARALPVQLVVRESTAPVVHAAAEGVVAHSHT